MKAGGTALETGAYEGHIKEAIWGASAAKGTKFLELSFETSSGNEVNFMRLYYQKATGEEVKGGASMINAIMGLTRTQSLTEKQVGIDQQTNTPIVSAPELIGKDIGLLLQKVLYTKNDGTEGYKFEIRLPYNPKTRQTLKEMVANSEPKTLDILINSTKDKDERNKGSNVTQAFSKQQDYQQPAQGGFGQPTGQPAPPPPAFGDDWGANS